MTFAKAVTNGFMPLGGVMVGDKVADVLLAGGGEFNHGLTYSGHPAACAAGLATLDILKNSNVIENTKSTIGPHLQTRLAALADPPVVGEVRGRGMFAAVELVKDKTTRERLAPDSAAAVVCREAAIAGGLMVRATGDAMIMAPPLICSIEEIDILVDTFAAALDATADHYGIS